MQINRNMSAVVANNQLLRIENKLSASMERLSSGLKINHASDDPAGIAISSKMKAQIDALDKAEQNASDGVSLLQIADGALGEVVSILQRMRELAVQAANGTNEYEDRQSMQDEIDELKKEVDRISEDTEYNTKSLLDGSSDIRIYGSNATRFTASDSVSAQVYTMNVESVAQKATVELPYEVPDKGGRMTINGVVVNIISGMTKEAYLQEVRTAAAEAGCSVSIKDDKMLITSDYYGYDESIEFVMDKSMAESMAIQDPDFVTDNEDLAYEVSEAEMTLPKSAATMKAGDVISINGVKIEITDEMINDDAKYKKALEQAVDTAGLGITETVNGFVVKSDSASREIISFSFSYDLAKQLNIVNKYTGDYTVNTRGTDAVVTIPTSQTDPSVRKDTGFTDTTTVETEGNRVTITDNNGFEIGFLLDSDYDPNTSGTEFKVEVTDIGSLKIQVGANEGQEVDMRIKEVSSESLYIDTVDVAVKKGADRAMVVLDEAIATLSEVRSKIGAYENRLEHAESALATAHENITAAYSGIMDTDMATEMTEYTQQNVLSQAATSVLAQANQLPEQILSLLR